MPDVYGKYSLTELAKELAVTPAFINRIQRETGIGGSVGTKGHPVSFDAHYMVEFRMIKGLRWWGFTFKEIKEIWGVEERLISLLKPLLKKYPEQFFPPTSTPMIIHPVIVNEVNSAGKEIVKEVASYGELLRKYNHVAVSEVHRRRKLFLKEVAKIEEQFKNGRVDAGIE